MKKIILSVGILLLLVNSAVLAGEKAAEKKAVVPEFRLRFLGSYVAAYPDAEMSRELTGQRELKVGHGYSFGSEIEINSNEPHLFMSSFSGVFGVRNSYQPISTERTYSEPYSAINYSEILNASYIDINLGARAYILDFLYAECGFVYSLIRGNWEKEQYDSSGKTIGTKRLSDEEMEYYDNSWGLYAGLGASIPVNDTVNIDVGVRAQYSLGSALEGQFFEYTNRSISATGGVTFKF
ncbi:MAG: hypothetical protein GY754_46260 [bacterium]|nr:hypothetical protein [bacterium]